MSKQQVINWFKEFTRAPELELVDSSMDNYARHICNGGINVYLIPKLHYTLNTQSGAILIEYYQCQACGKVIMNKNFM